MNAHDDLTGTGFRVGDVLQLHDFRQAKFVNADRFHSGENLRNKFVSIKWGLCCNITTWLTTGRRTLIS
jgi:hypothetical protein